jgi:hypothetical protein
MQITIDTNKDSPDDIEKAIKLLSTLISGKSKNSNIFENSSSDFNLPATPAPAEPSGSIFNMFGDNPTSVAEQKPAEPEKKKNIPMIIEY